ncbi:hypothetical protein PROFUN_03068 [Planoprotostelium fungivorum]|uniref:Glycosyl transferase 64 domain-containing protein n=1 Tax=Planoprotostelium fungivorum TaxID=1890364 RepID=A0A2P6NQ45_9EUKA|nr:hypothetical protein PROFUN_03068 [Planoprotostelium fungivorum]
MCPRSIQVPPHSPSNLNSSNNPGPVNYLDGTSDRSIQFYQLVMNSDGVRIVAPTLEEESLYQTLEAYGMMMTMNDSYEGRRQHSTRLFSKRKMRSSKISTNYVLMGMTCFLLGFIFSGLLKFGSFSGSEAVDTTASEPFNPALSSARRTDKYTIAIHSWKRHILLKKNIAHWQKLPNLDQIIVTWGITQGPVPSDFIDPTWSIKPTVVEKPINALTTRFDILNIIRTEAVLSHDDDLFIDLDELEWGFRVFQNFGRGIVGWTPRTELRGADGNLTYNWTPNSKRYTMVLTNLAFVSFDLLTTFMSDRIMEHRQHIDRVMNCEDILLNFLHVEKYKSPPLLLGQNPSSDNINCGGKKGISSGTSHNDKRSECLNMFEKVYGPLIPSDAAVGKQLEGIGFNYPDLDTDERCKY